MSWNWKKTVGIGLSVFALLTSSVGLTGCDIAGEVEQEGEKLEQEEDGAKEEE